MPKKEAVKTSHAPAPIGPYHQAVKAGGFLFVSGQIALDPETNALISDQVEEQTHQVMKNIGAILKASLCDFDHVVKSSIFVQDMNDFGRINEIYGSYFSGTYPARETVEVSRLPKDVKIEISVIATLE